MTVIWLVVVRNHNLNAFVSDATFHFQKHSQVDEKSFRWLYLPHLQLTVFSSCQFSFFSTSKFNEVKMKKSDLDFFSKILL
jgi:hypothetical protein